MSNCTIEPKIRATMERIRLRLNIREMAKTAPKWDMLQLADVCATTMFLTYEVNPMGFCVPYNGKTDGYGIKFFASGMRPDIEELHSKKVCGKCAKK